MSESSCEFYETSNKKQKSNITHNRFYLAQCCDRYNISDRAGAALATSVLIDHGIIEPNDTKVVIDRSKLGREQMRHREEMRKEEKELFGKVDGIYVDGKKRCYISVERSGWKILKKGRN